MTVNEGDKAKTAEPAAEPKPDDGTAEISAAVDADVAAGGESLEEQVRRLEAEKSDLTDRLLRVAADMDNLRRRSEREASDARRYAVTRFAADMLAVSDNLSRTLAAIPQEAREAGDPAFKAILDGVEITGREMERVLKAHGVTRIAAAGEPFDPHNHQAMFEIEDTSVPAGTVVQVVQDGYSIGDRVLRAALVGIAKGGPAKAADLNKNEAAAKAAEEIRAADA
jgi:molecular chaperone GrpE